MKVNSKLLNVKMALKGYTLAQFADVSGVSKATLSAVKNGKSCSFDTAVKIAKALNLDTMEIIDNAAATADNE